MGKQRTIIELSNGYRLVLSYVEFDDIDLDKLLRIDIANLSAEIVTIPIAMSKFGMLLADATNDYNQVKIKLSILEADKRHQIRDDKNIKERKTEQFLDDQIKMYKPWKALKKLMYKKMRDMEYVNSIYWGLKSKDDKLNKLSLTIKAGDIYDELITTKLKYINGVKINVIKPS